MIEIKRIYEDYSHNDGYRILVDRLWPRGISKDHVRIDLWIKESTSNNELRKWYHDNSNSLKSNRKLSTISLNLMEHLGLEVYNNKVKKEIKRIG